MQLFSSNILRVSLVVTAALAFHLSNCDMVLAQSSGRSADSTAIVQAIARWERGWEIYDAELAARDYSSDADWTNAFGMRRIGRDSIQALLRRVFEVPAVTAGATRYEYHDLRFLGETIAMLRSKAIREGQQLADGATEIRRINHLRVFARVDGQWTIVSHLVADERTPGQAR